MKTEAVLCICRDYENGLSMKNMNKMMNKEGKSRK
ncbi:hypothetical protein CLS_33620 [[Clostridium] cf. saccharolyticum K10]|nr:hypothetical protein CLS_33620 [[Clostridium] cf. saccharolyticum K10]